MVDLETCIEGIRDVVVVIDDRGAVLYASPSVERVLGYDPEEVMGDGVLQYVHPDDRDHVEAALQATTSESDDVVEPVSYRVRHADGSWVPMETASAVRRDPETGGYALVVTDVSERVALERELARYEAILDSQDDDG